MPKKKSTKRKIKPVASHVVKPKRKKGAPKGLKTMYVVNSSGTVSEVEVYVVKSIGKAFEVGEKGRWSKTGTTTYDLSEVFETQEEAATSLTALKGGDAIWVIQDAYDEHGVTKCVRRYVRGLPKIIDPRGNHLRYVHHTYKTALEAHKARMDFLKDDLDSAKESFEKTKNWYKQAKRDYDVEEGIARRAKAKAARDKLNALPVAEGITDADL